MTPGSTAEPDADLVDALELELRQLAGVRYVSFTRIDGVTVIELVVDAGTDANLLGTEARHLARVHLNAPIQVEILGAVGSGPTSWMLGRVRLLLTVPRPGQEEVGIYLAYQDRTVTIEVATEERGPVAEAIVDGLRQLGLPVPFEVVGAHGLSDELGSGTLVVLRDPSTGVAQRGLATGRQRAESTARAVLNALNRSLQPAAVTPLD